MKNVLILGRGESLKYIDKIDESEYDTCFIVNNFQNEIEKSKDLYNFILKTRRLIHVVGRDLTSLMCPKTYKILKVEKVVLNVLKQEYFGHPPFKRESSIKRKLNSSNIKSCHLPDNIINYSLDPHIDNGKAPFPTTGICCVGYALSQKSCTSITTLGIDFYKSDYFYGSIISRKKQPTERQKTKGDKMIDHVFSLASARKDVKFKVMTSSNIKKSHLENLDIVRLS